MNLAEYFPSFFFSTEALGQLPEHLNIPKSPDSKPLLTLSVAAFNLERSVGRGF